jgi:hypothetical protein
VYLIMYMIAISICFLSVTFDIKKVERQKYSFKYGYSAILESILIHVEYSYIYTDFNPYKMNILS